jgi:hypothetical protein
MLVSSLDVWGTVNTAGAPCKEDTDEARDDCVDEGGGSLLFAEPLDVQLAPNPSGVTGLRMKSELSAEDISGSGSCELVLDAAPITSGGTGLVAGVELLLPGGSKGGGESVKEGTGLLLDSVEPALSSNPSPNPGGGGTNKVPGCTSGSGAAATAGPPTSKGDGGKRGRRVGRREGGGLRVWASSGLCTSAGESTSLPVNVFVIFRPITGLFPATPPDVSISKNK